jgi:serine/threonine protein phosphatase PrpC
MSSSVIKGLLTNEQIRQCQGKSESQRTTSQVEAIQVYVKGTASSFLEDDDLEVSVAAAKPAKKHLRPAGGDLRLWVQDFIDSQHEDLKPTIVQNKSSSRYSFTQVSIKGARHEQQDTAFSDGQLFSVFDGHGGTSAASFACSAMSKHFYTAQSNLAGNEIVGLGGVPTPEEEETVHVEQKGKGEGYGPLQSTFDAVPANVICPPVVRALHSAYMNTQRGLACSEQCKCQQSGCTAVTCWIEPVVEDDINRGTGKTIGQTRPIMVYSACLGDSLACLFDTKAGRLVSSSKRVWDEEMGTLHSDGRASEGEEHSVCLTAHHQITGMLQFDCSGAVTAMQNDPTGIGFREWKLLFKKHKFTLNSEFRLTELVERKRSNDQRSPLNDHDVDPHPAPPSWNASQWFGSVFERCLSSRSTRSHSLGGGAFVSGSSMCQQHTVLDGGAEKKRYWLRRNFGGSLNDINDAVNGRNGLNGLETTQSETARCAPQHALQHALQDRPVLTAMTP